MNINNNIVNFIDRTRYSEFLPLCINRKKKSWIDRNKRIITIKKYSRETKNEINKRKSIKYQAVGKLLKWTYFFIFLYQPTCLFFIIEHCNYYYWYLFAQPLLRTYLSTSKIEAAFNNVPSFIITIIGFLFIYKLSMKLLDRCIIMEWSLAYLEI